MTVLTGNLLRPGDEEYARLCCGWNTRVVHRPEYCVAAKSPEHVQDAVRLAAERRLPIRVQSTGHGVLAASIGGMLIDTSRLGGVRVDPVRQIAEIGGRCSMAGVARRSACAWSCRIGWIRITGRRRGLRTRWRKWLAGKTLRAVL